MAKTSNKNIGAAVVAPEQTEEEIKKVWENGGIIRRTSTKNVSTLKVKRLSKEAVLPTKSYKYAAGFDLYALKAEKIAANGIKAISTGIAVEIPIGFYGQIFERSGFSLKSTLTRKAGVIDSDYRGEIKVIMQNSGAYPETVEAGQKFAQLVILPIPTLQVEEVEELSNTDRGEKGFGSSDVVNARG